MIDLKLEIHLVSLFQLLFQLMQIGCFILDIQQRHQEQHVQPVQPFRVIRAQLRIQGYKLV